jgi:hypothetical protein
MILKTGMIMKTGGRSRHHQRWQTLRLAIVTMVFSMAGCTGQDPGAQTGNEAPGTEVPTPTQTFVPPVLSSSIRQDSIDPSMRPDPEAFHATGLGLWDGERTLPGVWIAYPMAEMARSVRLTNVETGAQTDAALFRRDPNLSGPRIIVSSEAAELLGLTPGHATQMTIDALTYRSDTETASAVAGTAEELDPVPAEVPADEAATEPATPDLGPLAPASAPPAALEPAAADTGLLDAAAAEAETETETGPKQDPIDSAAESAGEEPKPGPLISPPKPKPNVTPDDPAPDVSGEITDGRHFIQAGIFGQPGNAARLMKKLRAVSLPVEELPLILSGRALTRVLIGPYRTVAERDTALEIVRRLGPEDATIIRTPAQVPAQVPVKSKTPTPTQG